MNETDRADAARHARHSVEYFTIAKHVRPDRRPRMVARAEHFAEQAFRFARARAGYRDAVIAGDGILVILTNARAAGAGHGGAIVTIEHELDPRRIAFPQTNAARIFMRSVKARGARAAALALDRRAAPAEQVELFSITAMGAAAC